MALILNPVWPQSPPICPVAFLPSLKTLPELMLWLAKNGPSCQIKRVWQCTEPGGCGGFHADVYAPDPSGSSSGTGRSHRHDEP